MNNNKNKNYKIYDNNFNYKLQDILIDYNNLENKYICEICADCLFSCHNKIESFQCKEGHVFCTNCWKLALSKKECMVCRTPCSFDTLSKNILLQNDFRNKKINCPNIFKFNNNNKNKELEKDEKFGCKKIITIDELESHLKNCPFQFIECPFNNDVSGGGGGSRCTFKIRKNGIDKHRETCSLTIGICKYCKFDFKDKEILKQHIETTCPKFPIKCTQECTKLIHQTITTKKVQTTSTVNSIVMIERGNLQNHIQNDCPKTIITCKYKQGGCNLEFQRSDELNHLEIINHSVFIQNIRDEQFRVNQEQFKIFQEKLEFLENENKQLKLDFQNTESKLTQENKQLKVMLENLHNNYNNVIVGHLNKIYLSIGKLESQNSELKDSQCLNSSSLTVLDKQIQNFQNIQRNQSVNTTTNSSINNRLTILENQIQNVQINQSEYKYSNKWRIPSIVLSVPGNKTQEISFGKCQNKSLSIFNTNGLPTLFEPSTTKKSNPISFETFREFIVDGEYSIILNIYIEILPQQKKIILKSN